MLLTYLWQVLLLLLSYITHQDVNFAKLLSRLPYVRLSVRAYREKEDTRELVACHTLEAHLHTWVKKHGALVALKAARLSRDGQLKGLMMYFSVTVSIDEKRVCLTSLHKTPQPHAVNSF